MEVRLYTPSDSKLWDNFIKSSRMPMFMFERGFMDYHADRFQDASLLFFHEGQLMAVLPASKHGCEVRSHGGLTYGGMIYGEKMKQVAMLECFNAMVAFFHEQGIRSITYKTIPHIYHKQPAEDDLYALFVNKASLLKAEPSTVINLKSPYKMPKGRKAQISRAKREGVKIVETEDFETFINLENQVLKEKHGTSAVHSADELTLLKGRFPENIRCLAAYFGEELIAGTILFVYDSVVHTQYLAADEKARECGALDLVIATAIDNYKSSHSFLDFGISSEDNGQVLNAGLISQKEGFGGRTNIYSTWKIAI